MNNSIYSKNYTKIDMIFVFIYYTYIIILNLLYFKIITNYIYYFDKYIFLKFIINISINIFQLLPIILFIRYRNQGLNSIGISKNNIIKSLLKGFVYFIPILCIRIFFLNYNISISSISIFNIDSILQLINVALVEEIIFRGFIQSRVSGILKNRFCSIIIVGFMFSFIHSTKYMIIGFSNIGFINFILGSLRLTIKHIYYSFIVNNTNSILTSTITHWLNNIL